jgi:hypothetical protein
MVEYCEKSIKVGFTKNPARVLDDIEGVCAQMFREGWELKDTCIEDGLGRMHLFFERSVPANE